MKEITLEIPEERYEFFLELMQSLQFAKVKTPSERKPKRELTFNAIKLNTLGYKFDREEANERR